MLNTFLCASIVHHVLYIVNNETAASSNTICNQTASGTKCVCAMICYARWMILYSIRYRLMMEIPSKLDVPAAADFISAAATVFEVVISSGTTYLLLLLILLQLL